MGYGVRPDDGQPMLPEGPVHLIGREPGLGGHLQDMSSLAFAWKGGHKAITVVGIGCGNIIIQRCSLVLDWLTSGVGLRAWRSFPFGSRTADQKRPGQEEPESAAAADGEGIKVVVDHSFSTERSFLAKRDSGGVPD